MNAPTIAPAPVPPERLTVLYDEWCALCRRARDWLLTQPCLVEVELLAAGSQEADERYRGMPWRGRELVVVDEHGNAWVGPAAFITVMWATVRFRGWSYRLSTPTFAPLAERFFRHVSKRRARWGELLGRGERQEFDPACSWCD